MVGLSRRQPGGDGARPAPAGPLHAVEGAVGRQATADHTDVRALCGEWVQVVPVEEVPDDAGLCEACQSGH